MSNKKYYVKMPEMSSEPKNEGKFRCPNPYCGKTFDEPKIIKFCPYCYAEVKEEKRSECPHWFGYLSQKEDGKGVPPECFECERTIECLLKKHTYSAKATKEIKKWF